MVEQGKADSPAVLGPAYRILLRFRYTDPFWSVERCRQQNTGVLATWYICLEKALVRAIERIFTRCRSMCNQGKI
jgi:hypothetical protein